MSKPFRDPLRFERICLEKVWGGRRLATVPGFELPGHGPIGETWELSDRTDHNSVVVSESWRGRSLRELLRENAADIFGRTRPAAEGLFPLLVKFLDAREHLSIQVHPPSDARLNATGDPGKTECWFILAADQDAKVWLGAKPGVCAADIARAANQPEIVDLLEEWRVSVGDFFFVPGGTLHAIGAGITLLEVQENSDTTHRLYDWGRLGLDGKPRPVHIDKALESTQLGTNSTGPQATRWHELEPGVRRASLVDCPQFRLERLALANEFVHDTHDVALIYTVLSGRGRVGVDGLARSAELNPGDVWLVPARSGRHTLWPDPSGLDVVQVTTKA